MSEHDVVVTGLGLITAGARSPQELFERLETGDLCMTVKDDLQAAGIPNPAGVYIDGATWRWLDAAAQTETCWDSPLTRLALCAADQAVAQSGLERRRRRAGIFAASNRILFDSDDLAAAIGSLDSASQSVDLDQLVDLACRGAKNFHGRRDLSALALAHRYGFQDAAMTSSDACAAGGFAIGTAYRYIRHGELDVAIAGGTELLGEFLPVLSFTAMDMACHPGRGEAVCRPFDKERRGFVIGEGSAFLLLESAEHARARGATVLARIAGFAKQAEGGRVVASAEDGSEFVRCMQAALEDAGLSAEDIDHINAHGTSTHLNDACESLAIARLFGSRASEIPVTSNKSFTGYTLGASGAIEAVLSVLSLLKGMLLPTLNYRSPDPELPPLNIVVEPRRASLRTVMSNSFGMGGENCSLILAAA